MRHGARSWGAGVIGLMLIISPVRAAEPAGAAQLAGLFVQGCMAFAGDPGGLRAWAGRNRLPALPDAATKTFLHGAPGRVFDGSAPGVKLVLASSDDGLCSAITDTATTDAVTRALEDGLIQAGVKYRLAIDRDDTASRSLHFREYLATRAGRSWRILAATVHDPTGGHAMLTAAPE